MKTNKPKLKKNIVNNRTQKIRQTNANKSSTFDGSCARHKNIEHVFIVWWRVYSKNIF